MSGRSACSKGLPNDQATCCYEAQRNSGQMSKIPRSWRGSALLGFAIMFHSDDYISFFVSCFDIPVRLGSLFQRKSSIYDCFYLPRLNKLFDEN